MSQSNSYDFTVCFGMTKAQSFTAASLTFHGLAITGALQVTRCGMQRPCDRGTKDSSDLFQQKLISLGCNKKKESVCFMNHH